MTNPVVLNMSAAVVTAVSVNVCLYVLSWLFVDWRPRWIGRRHNHSILRADDAVSPQYELTYVGIVWFDHANYISSSSPCTTCFG